MGPRNKVGHSAHGHKRCRQVPVASGPDITVMPVDWAENIKLLTVVAKLGLLCLDRWMVGCLRCISELDKRDLVTCV